MSMLEIVIASALIEEPLPFPAYVFAIISAAVFTALGLVVWSFRDVANRHSHKTSETSGHGTDHH